MDRLRERFWHAVARKAFDRRKAAFSPALYELFDSRVTGAMQESVGCTTFAAVIAVLGCIPLFLGYEIILPAAVGCAFFLFVAGTSIFGTPSTFKATVLPYFERKLGGIDTWMAGRDLLWNSRALDEAAIRLGMRPLSEFVSGDPLIGGEEVCMFDAAEALPTVDALLGSAQGKQMGEKVREDLAKLRCALAIAEENGVRFSLHLRLGDSASGAEMDARQGSYF